MDAPTQATGETRERTHWPLVCALMATGVVAAFHVGKVPPTLPLLREELRFGLTGAGLELSTLNIIGMSIGMIAGFLADRIGLRRTVAGGLALLCLADIGGASAHSLHSILAWRFVEGIGFFAAVVASPPLIIAAANGRHHRLVLGIWGAYMPAGTALMMVAAPVALELVGWRGLWLANAALSLAALVCLAIIASPATMPPRPSIRLTWQNLRTVLLGRGPLLLALTFATYTFPYLAVIGFLPTYMIEQRGIVSSLAALLTALVVAANVIGNVATGPLQALGLPRWVLIACAAVCMTGSSLVIFDPHLDDGLRYAACLLFSAAGGMAPGALFASVPRNAPSPALMATTTGLMMQGSNLGSTLGPPTLALVVTATGTWQSGGWLLCIPLIVCVIAAALLGRNERKTLPAS